MNFKDFSRFYFLFLTYFSDFKSLKNCKKRFICADLREAEVARGSQTGEPWEPMQTHVDTYVAQWAESS